jgi:thiamine-phosphate pyrophosphorylase
MTIGTLYLVATPRPHMPDDEFVARVRAAIDGGVDVLQLRCKGMDALPYIRLADRLRALVPAEIPFIINDRPDVALACGADGVHLGQDDLPVELARRVLPDRIIGRSSHAPADAARAVEECASYFAVGPVWETPTKPGRRAAGLSYVEHVAASGIDIPWFAIGGITIDNVHEVLDSGDCRIAVVRAILDAADPAEAAAALRTAVRRPERSERVPASAGAALSSRGPHADPSPAARDDRIGHRVAR